MSEEAFPPVTLAGPGGNAPPVFLALGASGARTASLLRLIRALPADPAIATVIILSDREALDEEEFR